MTDRKSPLSGIISLFRLRQINFNFKNIMIVVALFFSGGAFFLGGQQEIKNAWEFENKRMISLVKGGELVGYEATIVYHRIDTTELWIVFGNFPKQSHDQYHNNLYSRKIYMVVPRHFFSDTILQKKWIKKYYPYKSNIEALKGLKYVGIEDQQRIGLVREGTTDNPPEEDLNEKD